MVQLGNPSKLYLTVAVVLAAVLTAVCLLLPRSYLLTACSDIITGLLMLCALFAFATHGLNSSGRMRWFWMLQAAGWGLWFGDQLVWITYDLVWRRKMPSMHPADALLFLAGAPMLAGVLLRPHRQPSERGAHLGLPDFFLLVLWWLYLYVSFVVCWQYISPNEDGYNRNYDLLAAAESILLAVVLAIFWMQSSGRWKKFYAVFCGAVVLNGIAFYVLNHALEENLYFTGSWYDIPYTGSFAIFTVVAVLGQDLAPVAETASSEKYVG